MHNETPLIFANHNVVDSSEEQFYLTNVKPGKYLLALYTTFSTFVPNAICSGVAKMRVPIYSTTAPPSGGTQGLAQYFNVAYPLLVNFIATTPILNSSSQPQVAVFNATEPIVIPVDGTYIADFHLPSAFQATSKDIAILIEAN